MTAAAEILAVRPVESADSVWLEKSMGRTRFFSHLGQAQLAKVLPYMLMLRYAGGSILCAEGEPGDAMYLIRTGVAVVTKQGLAQSVARLQEGDFFGEMALLLGEPRSATVAADGELEVFCLASVDYRRFLDRSPDMTSTLRGLAEARRQELARL